MTNWIKRNKIEFFLIVGVLLLSAFLRLYKIDQYMTFLGDEGRDAIVIKKILTEFDLPLLGPPTSIGNMYLGPLYYYMMVIPMAIFWLNPVAAAGLDALIGVMVVGLIYYLSRVWFGRAAALIASVLYALSPVNIIYSHSSWNPNPAPFFALLMFLGLYFVHKYRDFRWLILVGGAGAFAVQMHYLALILLPIAAILWGYELWLIRFKHRSKKYFWLGTLLGVLVFLFLMSPLVIFDFRHNFLNYRAMTTFFSNRETTVNINPLNTLGRVVPIYQENLIDRYISGSEVYVNILVSILILVPLWWGVYQKVRFGRAEWPNLAVNLWLLIGILGLALYKQTIYDHYLGFMNPAPFILLGAVTVNIKSIPNLNIKRVLDGLLLFLVLLLGVVNLQRSPLLSVPNDQLRRTQEISKYIISKSAGKPFNFALIAEHNYDAAYQFYLDLYGHKPLQVPFDITDQLFVVCEDKACQPVGHPKYEIAAFGWTRIAEEDDFDGVKVFKLVKNPEGKK